jgi:hypothetical protein
VGTVHKKESLLGFNYKLEVGQTVTLLTSICREPMENDGMRLCRKIILPCTKYGTQIVPSAPCGKEEGEGLISFAWPAYGLTCTHAHLIDG